jgi:ABC-type lipoprotein export system ATPase subunit
MATIGPDRSPMPNDHTTPLVIKDLRFRYESSFEDEQPWELRIRSLTLARGEQALLTAGSGRGKSTLLALIAGLMEPGAGTVAIGGTNIHALAGHERDLFRGRHIGMIFQTFNLLSGFTALENVMAALMFSQTPSREHRGKAAAILGTLGITRHDALVDRMSVGQQQRVAVARAVACDPVLVLADEPTASLDPENAAAAMDLIQETCRSKGAALLCVSHDPAMGGRFTRREKLDELGAAQGEQHGLEARATP